MNARLCWLGGLTFENKQWVISRMSIFNIVPSLHEHLPETLVKLYQLHYGIKMKKRRL